MVLWCLLIVICAVCALIVCCYFLLVLVVWSLVVTDCVIVLLSTFTFCCFKVILHYVGLVGSGLILRYICYCLLVFLIDLFWYLFVIWLLFGYLIGLFDSVTICLNFDLLFVY